LLSWQVCIFFVCSLGSCFFLFQLDSLLLVAQLEQKETLTLPKWTTIYKTYIYKTYISLIIITFTNKALQIFCAPNECNNDYNEWCLLLKLMVTKKMCDTKKNVTKMGGIIKGIYCITFISILRYNPIIYGTYIAKV